MYTHAVQKSMQRITGVHKYMYTVSSGHYNCTFLFKARFFSEHLGLQCLNFLGMMTCNDHCNRNSATLFKPCTVSHHTGASFTRCETVRVVKYFLEAKVVLSYVLILYPCKTKQGLSYAHKSNFSISTLSTLRVHRYRHLENLTN